MKIFTSTFGSENGGMSMQITKLVKKWKELLVYRLFIFTVLILVGNCSERSKLISALNDLPKLEKLLASGVNPNARSNEWEPTALSIAINENNIAAAKLLINAGADPHLSSSSPSAVNEAVCLGNIEIFQLILAKHPSILESEEILSGLVSTATVCKRPEMIDLIPKGKYFEANINLLYACGSDSKKYDAKAALLAGANPNELDSVKRNPFYHKDCYRNTDLLLLAVNKGLNIDNRDAADKTILMVASEELDFEGIKALLRAGASWDNNVVVYIKKERTVKEKTSRREMNYGTGRNYEIKENKERTLVDTIEVPLVDYAREHDPEIYRMLMAKKPKDK